MKRLAYCIVAVTICLPLAAQTRLEPGKKMEARLEAGRPDVYVLDLKQDDYIDVLAGQTEVDLALRLQTPDGKQLQDVDLVSGLGAAELLIYRAEATGTYRIELRPANDGENGRYTVQLTVQRPATPRDREAAAADTRLQQLIDSDSPDAAVSIEQLAEEFGRLPIARRQAQAWFEAGRLRRDQFDFDRAIADFEKSLALSRDGGEPSGQGSALLDGLGASAFLTSRYEKAIGYWEQALAIFREIRDRVSEGKTLNDLGLACKSLSRNEEALRYYEQALRMARELKNRDNEGGTLHNIGMVYLSIGQPEKAIGYYEQALAIERETKNRSSEGITLGNLGVASYSLSQYEKAIGYYEQALAIAREVKNRALEGMAVTDLGNAYQSLGRYERAIVYHEQALAIGRETRNRNSEGMAFNNLGTAYLLLGQNQKAIGNFEQALAIAREVKDRATECTVLGNIGEAYRDLGQDEKAIGYYQQSLATARDIQERAAEARAFNNLGGAYASMNQYEKAISHYQQALEIEREIKNRDLQSVTLNVLGDTWRALHQYEKAIAGSEQALAAAREVKALSNEHYALSSLMQDYQAINQPRLAAFYGKQAIGVVQEIRSDIRDLSREVRNSFFESKKISFRTLAQVLISQGRLIEAQQVLTLLKDQEFFDYAHPAEAATAGAGLTLEEAEWVRRYRQAAENLANQGAALAEFQDRRKKQPALADSTELQSQLAGLQQELASANRGFEQLLRDLRQHFAARLDPASAAIDLKEAEALKTELGTLKHGAVAIYTLVAADRYVAILVTPSGQHSYESRVPSAELNRKILAFREALEDPSSDPLPAAQELYQILIPPPLAADLRQAQAETLMWSLDGPLRYLPVAALHDGKQYLIEEYRLAIFTPASNMRLLQEGRRTGWRAVAFGVAAAHPGFDPLPGVSTELESIVREKPGDRGVLEGRRLLDAQFTRAALDRELKAGYPVVHVASHFQFRPGDDTRSFLLLGDGSQLTLADLKAAGSIFARVDLLTLSACSTGVGDVKNADGSEVEGFGVLAQRQGAKAVVASLWPVADASTGELMREFYSIYQSGKALTKVDALRGAQLRMLRGDTSITRANIARGVIIRSDEAPRGFRHPYYWAPFFLMGNWL